MVYNSLSTVRPEPFSGAGPFRRFGWAQGHYGPPPLLWSPINIFYCLVPPPWSREIHPKQLHPKRGIRPEKYWECEGGLIVYFVRRNKLLRWFNTVLGLNFLTIKYISYNFRRITARISNLHANRTHSYDTSQYTCHLTESALMSTP